MTVAEIDKQQLEAERRLSVALDDYAGEWVGICDHSVVVHAATLGELVERIKAAQIEEVEVLQVPEDPNAACFF
jgi:Family of unknown function (DUF5678)